MLSAFQTNMSFIICSYNGNCNALLCDKIPDLVVTDLYLCQSYPKANQSRRFPISPTLNFSKVNKPFNFSWNFTQSIQKSH